ncbi:MAG: ZIP family metal transporter [Gemmatimonadota bacterium]|nr:ZIP family metal transporter [Gemmatimonadota bacterium]
MLDALRGLDPVLQALAAGGFTWAVTAAGAAVVVFTRGIREWLVDGMLGFASGVMLAASFWSLLAPAIVMSAGLGVPDWLPASTGFVAGALVLGIADRLLPHLHPLQPISAAEGPPAPWKRSTLLVTAITMHNVPEGLAVGVAFGAAALGMGSAAGASFEAALALAIGIGLQNFPEGVAVAMPLRAAGATRGRSFWAGTFSAAVEPVAAVAGAAAVLQMQAILPYALAFAAGAMVYVVVEELIPESQQGGRTDLATAATVAGFTVMMVLDVALG